jgi:hypothetical protein
MSPSPELCVFCDNELGSTEHAWPDWIRRHFLERAGGAAAEGTVQERREDGLVVVRFTDLDEFETAVDCVCHTCNTQWMARMERKVAPLLKPMIDGLPTRLTALDRRHLLRWAAKTASVMECDGDTLMRTPRDVSSTIRLDTSPPEIQAYIGRYEGRHLLQWNRVVIQRPSRSVHRDDMYVFWSNFIIGKVLIQVFTHPRDPDHPPLVGKGREILIELGSAADGVVTWPPSRFIDDCEVELISRGPTTRIQRQGERPPPPTL